MRSRALVLLLAAQACAGGGYWAASAFASANAPTQQSAGSEAPAEAAPEEGTETKAQTPGETTTTTTGETPAPPIPPVPAPEAGNGSETSAPTQGQAGTSQETPAAPVKQQQQPSPVGHESPGAPVSSASAAQQPSEGPRVGPATSSSEGVGKPYVERRSPSGSLTHKDSRGVPVHRRRHASSSHGDANASAGAPSAQSLADAFAEITPVLPGIEGLAEDTPPSFLLPIYHAAAKRYHVPWAILAAINQVETDYGRNLSVSSAGAEGWMQFMPATWAQWGIDADGDGVANPYSPIDAIFSAARYLQANGAASDLPAAIYAYNHAGWYVAAVMLRARMLEHSLAGAPLRDGYSLPLDRAYMAPLGRTDDGVDIENAPDGALVYSITPGVVTAVASDPGGFGPNYPVVEATAGPLAGQHVYYGHVAQSLVRVGEHVGAGQPIAIVGHTGDAASLGHGHIEIGFGDAAGTPLDQHGAVAATAAGAVMRSFLIELSASFGVAGG